MEDKRYNILLLDDEKNILNSLKRLLRREPYNLLLANTAAEGIKLLNETEAQIIISDYRMPGKNGIEFLKEVKKICPESIRMVLSGYADIDAIIKAVNEGEIYKFLTKPWNDEELKITVKRAIEQYELQKENKSLTLELKALNKSLEAKVEERTMELKIRNDVLLLSQEVMECLPFAIIGLDREGLITLANQKSVKLFQGGESFLGERFVGRLPAKVTESISAMNMEKDMEIEDVQVNEKIFRVRVSTLGAEGNARGLILTFLEDKKRRQL